MRTSATLLIVATTLAGGHVLSAQCPGLMRIPGTEKPAVSKVDLHADETQVKTGSPVWVEATMTNMSDHAVSFWKNTRGEYVVEVSDATGTLLPDKRPAYRHGRLDPELVSPKSIDPKLIDSGEIVDTMSGSLACVTLKPNQATRERIEVTKFYNLTQPGAYTIVVEAGDPEGVAPVRSKPLKITVTK